MKVLVLTRIQCLEYSMIETYQTRNIQVISGDNKPLQYCTNVKLYIGNNIYPKVSVHIRNNVDYK